MRRLLLPVVCAVVLTGCGVLDDEGPALSQGPDPALYGPSEAAPGKPPPIDIPQLQSPDEQVAQSLEAGEVGVVGMTGVIGVRPKTLDTATDARLESLEWQRWGSAEAVGRGEMRSRDCQPTCANGRTRMIPATITLAGVRECRGRRYYESASVRVAADDTASGEQPASYVRAPC